MSETAVYAGAAMVSPAGKVYACECGDHDRTQHRICFEGEMKDAFEAAATRHREQTGGYLGHGRFLDQRGWVRVGSEGGVTDSNWDRVRGLTNAQWDALWDMLQTLNDEVARAEATGGYARRGFRDRLNDSLRRAMEAE